MHKAQAARQLLLQEGHGVLSTLSIDVPGYPFGSVAPYCVDSQCRPVIYISHIAQHTKNIVADPRVSLTVLESNNTSDDVQAQGRLTCLADAAPIGEHESELRERYFRYFPSARQYEQTHDFAFFRLELVRVRFIGGFGRIYWVEPGEFMLPNPFSATQETRIIQHMNDDHADSLKRYAGGQSAVMTGIDSEGFDVLTAAGKMRFSFDAPVRNMEEARHALVAMARRPA
jgi:putative heme iron utilization protein